ncbi:HPP family protein [Paenibacillus sp.]|uniref:HPP family protein n=1 Tax=Paenibacillus sp. TaxID=58172 RepID=UPI00281253B5|nr:HPP family protein [Paenibacillus sp.]
MGFNMLENKVAKYFSKMKGNGRNPLSVAPRTALIGFLGGFTAIGLLAWLTDATQSAWMMAPFGASCVLAFGVWDAPLSQPRNIVGGHLLSTFVGLILLKLFGNDPWVIALAVGLSVALMHLTRTTHPPAGADPIVVIMEGSPWLFLLTPVLAGSLAIVLTALVINNLDQRRKYPTFWA